VVNYLHTSHAMGESSSIVLAASDLSMCVCVCLSVRAKTEKITDNRN